MTATSTPPARSKRSRANNVTRGNGLTRKWNGGPAAHKEAVRRTQEAVRITARRRKAWRLFASDGLTFAEIGARLKVSNRTAWHDVMAVYRGLQAQGLIDADLLRARQQANIRAVIGRHMPKADRAESARVINDFLAREARLNGLDKQQATGYPAEQVAAMFSGLIAELLAAFTAREDRQRIIEAFRRRRIGAAEAEAVEAVSAPVEEKVG